MKRRLPAEWEQQSAIQLTWPHANTDWTYILKDIELVYIRLVEVITQYQKVVIVSPEIKYVKTLLKNHNQSNIIWVEANSDDTWARDHGGISIFEDGKPLVLDFEFNGWGNKYSHANDNLITQKIFSAKVTPNSIGFKKVNYILEGGGIESDGKGTLLTTESCLLNNNRNNVTKEQAEILLKTQLGVDRVLWLQHGHLSGDDTDGHIDTLARFTDESTIVYVKNENINHPDFKALQLMEAELQRFRKKDGSSYTLVPLMQPTIQEPEKSAFLPATYANFLIINGAILVPTYHVKEDAFVLNIFRRLFPSRDIIGIDCRAVIKQNGSLHCLTMNYLRGVFK